MRTRMRIGRSIIPSLLTAVAMLSGFTNAYAAGAPGEGAEATIEPVPAVILRAASGSTIPFRTENGEGAPTETRSVPHLVLHRNGALTDQDERTLIVEVTGIQVPPPGVTVTLTVETQHGDPDPIDEFASERTERSEHPFGQRGPERRIPVWREARWIANTSGVAQMRARAIFKHAFDATVTSDGATIATPTDYFRYDVDVTAPGRDLRGFARAPSGSGSAPLQIGADHAFLMENQHVARLPDVQEATAGAAPDELIIYYADMFPFRKNPYDRTTWLARKDVPGYVHNALAPRMVEAFRVQTNEWGFPWYPAWTSYRLEAGAERLSVALADGRTWYHGPAPVRGHSGISINVMGVDNAAYDTLVDGLMSTFHHELFHHLQRNISQNESGSGFVAGPGGAWEFFSEGTAVLASSVGQPNLQFKGAERAYVANANDFLGAGGLGSGLNESYTDVSPYNAAIYWRFLYEQCGRAEDGTLDAATGMAFIRRVLTILYSGDVVDITTSTDLVGALPEILDRALSGSRCPFDTHAESLTAFSRAIYGLRVEGGRCATLSVPIGCGLYDPHALYADPGIETVIYSGEDREHAGKIASSFGIDFVHVTLGRAANGRPLRLEFHRPPGTAAQFAIQVRELKNPNEGLRLQPASTEATGRRILETRSTTGELSYVIPAVDRTAYDRLGLIITRVDASERLDSVGEYTVVLRPNESNLVVCAPLSPTHC